MGRMGPLLVLLFPVLAAARPNVEKYQFKISDVKTALIHNSTGNIHIAPTGNQMTYVIVNKIKWGPRCAASVDLKNGELRVEMDDQAWILDHECRVDLIVSLPDQTPVQIRAGTGDVKVSGKRPSLDVKVGSGLITVKGEIDQLSALSGSGDIRLMGSAQKADLKTGSGDIELDYAQVPNSAKLLVKTGSGDVQVLLPEASGVRSRIATGNGTVVNEFADSVSASPLELDAASETGDIQIRKK